MAKLRVFNSISIDGYFTDAQGSLEWAHRNGNDPEWQDFTINNAASSSAVLVFGRVTYQMMESYWPTEQAKKAMPQVAEAMNKLPKVVFSQTLTEAKWSNSRLFVDDVVGTLQRLKRDSKQDLLIMGSGSLIAPLSHAGAIDEYQLVVVPVVLGAGRTMFEGASKQREMKLKSIRPFKNGNVVMTYAPAVAS